jgi:hypothetical protein
MQDGDEPRAGIEARLKEDGSKERLSADVEVRGRSV